MKHFRTSVSLCAVFALSSLLMYGQVTFNPNAARAIGQASLQRFAPNLVEGREFNMPQSIAIDANSSPSILYVSDTGNNRVLAWRDATRAAAGMYADLVIGQRDPKDFTSTSAFGPGTAVRGGLTAPTGIAVDARGNLYVIDGGNNRILRYPRPFDHPDDVSPNLVIGQPDLNSEAANQNGPVSASTIMTTSSSGPFRSALAFDNSGNLWFTDSGNNRVLRFPASALADGAPNGPMANLVLGQFDYFTRDAKQATVNDVLNRLGPNAPSGLAFDSKGALYVCGTLGSGQSQAGLVFVYSNPSQNGQFAARIMGVPPAPPQGQQIRVPNEYAFGDPEGVALIGNSPAVFDTANNRIMIFDPPEQWPQEIPGTTVSPKASSVIGQTDMFSRRAQASSTGLSGPVQGVSFNNEFYIVDASNNRVIVFPQSAPVWAGSRVIGQLGFNYSAPNLIEGRELYPVGSLPVRDPRSNQVRLLPVSGTAVIDTKSDPPHLYIADTGNNRVLAYRDARKAKTGAAADLVIGQTDMYSSGVNSPRNDANTTTETGLMLPAGLAVDANGDLWVADTGNSRVLRFPTPFNQEGGVRANLVLGQRDFFTKGSPDPGRSTMLAPVGLALTLEGHLLVSDLLWNRVLLFRKAGADFTNGMAASAVFGQPDFGSVAFVSTDPNSLNGPRGIATDSSDRLYVADTGNNRVVIYGGVTAPIPPSSWAVALPSLHSPFGIHVATNGEIWVADTQSTSCQSVACALKYPDFDHLAPNYRATVSLPSFGPLSIFPDSAGNLFVLEGQASRVSVVTPLAVAKNAGNLLQDRDRALAPGMWVSLIPAGGALAPQEQFGSAPFPKALGDVQVMLTSSDGSMKEMAAPLVYAGPTQINFLLPMVAPTSGSVDMVVQRASTGQLLASGSMRMDVASPALFTSCSCGTGQVAAVNDADKSVNDPANPVARGEFVQLYATGQGLVAGATADGDVPSGPIDTPEKPRVWIEPDYVPDENIQYSGLVAPGLWQINVKIPDNVAPGSRLIFIQYKNIFSSPPPPAPQIRTTIAVK